MEGSSEIQGTHQDAQKLTRTNLPLRSSKETSPPERLLRAKPGAFSPGPIPDLPPVTQPKSDIFKNTKIESKT